MKQADVIKKLTSNYPSLNLLEGDTFYWSPSEKAVYYKPDNTTYEGVWALLHESGHALLGHTQYYSDIELVTMEVEAWEKAKQIAEELSNQDLGSQSLELRKGAEIKNRMNNLDQTDAVSSKVQDLKSKVYAIDEDHIQDCLDSYRDWLHKRSLCPDCHLSGAQINPTNYKCIFCQKKWSVSPDRFCRPYRKKA